jgi:hypothetical protein
MVTSGASCTYLPSDLRTAGVPMLPSPSLHLQRTKQQDSSEQYEYIVYITFLIAYIWSWC